MGVILEEHLAGREGARGGVARDNCQFIDAVFWITRTGAPWGDLPPEYGGWSNTHPRFIRWREILMGLHSKIELAVDAHGMLLAACGYDSNAIIRQAKKQKTKVVIPPKKNRKMPSHYDKAPYELRHLVENAFLHLKRWPGIATRDAKNTSSFIAVVQIRCIALWANIL